MEREILFRGKSVITDEWVEGYYFKTTIGGKEIDCIAPVGQFVEMLHGTKGKGVYQIVPETRGEFTGLTDKNGTRIFEGDVVYIAREDERGIVSWDNDGACFKVVIDNISTTFRDSWYGRDLEVIGNIHDNPELVGGIPNEP